MKVLWVHNFIERDKNSGVFMYDLYDSFNSDEIDLYGVPNLLNPINFLKTYLELRKKSKEYDIIHAQYGSATGFLVALLGGKKILSLRGSDWYKTPSNSLKENIHISLGNWLTRLSLRQFDRIIVMSERMQKDISFSEAQLPISIIPDGINLNEFYPKNTIDEPKKHRVLFSTVDKTNILKRYYLAKEAVDILKQQIDDVEIVQMTQIPHNEVNDYINNSDVIILTSTHEGWPNIIKEGLAANIPFVATDVSDLKAIANKTNSCFVCEPKASILAEALYKSLNSSREELRPLVQDMEMTNINAQITKLYHQIIMGEK